MPPVQEPTAGFPGSSGQDDALLLPKADTSCSAGSSSVWVTRAVHWIFLKALNEAIGKQVAV